MSHELAEPSSPKTPPTLAPSTLSSPVGRPDATPEVSRVAPRSSRRQPWRAAWEWLRTNTFAPFWLPARWRHPAAGYLLALPLQVLAAVITRLLTASFPALTFPGPVGLLVVALVALNWGAGPSLFTILVGLVLRETVEAPAHSAGGQAIIAGVFEALLCLAVAAIISLAAGSTERSRRRAVEERAEAQARALATHQVQEHMDEFLAIASHDLRSPLTATVGYIDLAVRSYEQLIPSVLDTRPDLARSVATVQARLGDASQSGDRLCRLVNLLFDTAQARAGKLVLHRTPCDLVGLVREQVMALRLASPNRTLRLDLPAEGPVRVVVDADRIGQVVTNYLTNAMKYSPEDQPVAVRVALAGPWARVSVADHGPGLPASEQARIWQRFYRAEGIGVQSRSSTSLGLGLHICKSIIEGHGGKVGVESDVGKGSTFWCLLPLDGTRA
jgi:signal transduction histidine kinase